MFRFWFKLKIAKKYIFYINIQYNVLASVYPCSLLIPRLRHSTVIENIIYTLLYSCYFNPLRNIHLWRMILHLFPYVQPEIIFFLWCLIQYGIKRFSIQYRLVQYYVSFHVVHNTVMCTITFYTYLLNLLLSNELFVKNNKFVKNYS